MAEATSMAEEAKFDPNEVAERGFDTAKITKAFKDFQRDVVGNLLKAKNGSWLQVNEEILKDPPPEDLKKKCKGLFVGRLFLKQAKDHNPFYLIATCKRFMIMVPTGPIQSCIHLLAVPNTPLYNPVSMDAKEHASLMLEMQAGLRRVLKDIVDPGSKPRKLYMKQLKTAFATKPEERAHIRVTHPATKLDTDTMSAEEGVRRVSKLLDDFHAAQTRAKKDMLLVGATDFHLHDTCTVGQCHMHGWLPYEGVMSQMGHDLLYKNTPVDRILPVMYKVRDVKDPKHKRPRAVVKDKN